MIGKATADRIEELVREEDYTFKAAREELDVSDYHFREYRREYPEYDERLRKARWPEEHEEPGGRPAAVDDEVARQILDLLGKGETITHACEMMGVSIWAYRRYRQKNEEYDRMVHTAQQSQVEMMADALFMEGMGGNVRAMIFFLVNRTRFLPSDHPMKYRHIKDVTDAAASFLDGEAGDDGDEAGEDWPYDDEEQLAEVLDAIEDLEDEYDVDGSSDDSSGT